MILREFNEEKKVIFIKQRMFVTENDIFLFCCPAIYQNRPKKKKKKIHSTTYVDKWSCYARSRMMHAFENSNNNHKYYINMVQDRWDNGHFVIHGEKYQQQQQHQRQQQQTVNRLNWNCSMETVVNGDCKQYK